jgi:uncharacterized membrane protein YkvA (DUF1232 family)
MTTADWLLIGAGAAGLYAVGVLLLAVLGRRSDARALAGFIPDCIVLLRRLVADARVPRRRKLVLILLAGYLVMPVDLVPDFIPVAGQLDDVVIAALALRYALRGGSAALLREHWPGPERSLELVLRAASARSDGSP